MTRLFCPSLYLTSITPMPALSQYLSLICPSLVSLLVLFVSFNTVCLSCPFLSFIFTLLSVTYIPACLSQMFTQFFPLCPTVCVFLPLLLSRFLLSDSFCLSSLADFIPFILFYPTPLFRPSCLSALSVFIWRFCPKLSVSAVFICPLYPELSVFLSFNQFVSSSCLSLRDVYLLSDSLVPSCLSLSEISLLSPIYSQLSIFYYFYLTFIVHLTFFFLPALSVSYQSLVQHCLSLSVLPVFPSARCLSLFYERLSAEVRTCLKEASLALLPMGTSFIRLFHF